MHHASCLTPPAAPLPHCSAAARPSPSTHPPSTPPSCQVDSLRAKLLHLQRAVAALEGLERRVARSTLREGWGRVRDLERQMVSEVVGASEVLCATLVGVGGEALWGMRFPLVVIDECTQATEEPCHAMLGYAMLCHATQC